MADDPIVNQEQVSQTEPVSTEAETTEQPQPQYLTKDDLENALTSFGERIKQSTRDITKSEIAKNVPSVDPMSRIRNKYPDMDPDAARILESELSGVYRQKQEEESKAQFHQVLYEQLSDLGIDPKDERVDWGEGAGAFNEAFSRFNKSVNKIVKADIQAAREKAKQEADEKLQKERKDAGLDSVETTIPVGISTKTFTTEQISDRKFWEAHKDEILKAQEEGRITD